MTWLLTNLTSWIVYLLKVEFCGKRVCFIYINQQYFFFAAICSIKGGVRGGKSLYACLCYGLYFKHSTQTALYTRSYTGAHYFRFGKWGKVCMLFWFSSKIKGNKVSGGSVRNTGTLYFLLRGQLWLSETWNAVFKSFSCLFTICFSSQCGKLWLS